VKSWYYFLVYVLGQPPLWITSSPVILHRDRVRRKGAFILAGTHFSPFDVAILIKETPRVLDFVSVIEVFRHPLARWFFTNMGAFPLDRWKPDSVTVRTIYDRLSKGRVIAMFPEGNIRTDETSVLNGGRLKPGVGRIALTAKVPIIPCVLIGARAYHRPLNWLPLKWIKYGLIYGEPIVLKDESETEPRVFEERLRKVYQELHAELLGVMGSS